MFTRIILATLFAISTLSASDWGFSAGGSSVSMVPLDNWVKELSNRGLGLGGYSAEAGVVKFHPDSSRPSWGVVVGRESYELTSDGTNPRYGGVLGSPGKVKLTRLTVRKYANVSFGRHAGLLFTFGIGPGWGTATPDPRFTNYRPESRVIPVPELGVALLIKPSDNFSVSFGIAASPLPSGRGLGFGRF